MLCPPLISWLLLLKGFLFHLCLENCASFWGLKQRSACDWNWVMRLALLWQQFPHFYLSGVSRVSCFSLICHLSLSCLVSSSPWQFIPPYLLPPVHSAPTEQNSKTSHNICELSSTLWAPWKHQNREYDIHPLMVHLDDFVYFSLN